MAILAPHGLGNADLEQYKFYGTVRYTYHTMMFIDFFLYLPSDERSRNSTSNSSAVRFCGRRHPVDSQRSRRDPEE